MNRVSLIDLQALLKRISYCVPNRTLIPALVPMFLIISSSVYPAVMSSTENKDMQIIAQVSAQLKKISNDTSNLHATMPLSESQNIFSSSPTPMDPAFTASPSTSKELNATPTTMQQQQLQQQQNEVDNKMAANVINSGEQVHVVWDDDSPGNEEVLYKRDGADFDPTTVNLSETGDFSINPAIAVQGNNVHVVWREGAADIFYMRSTDRGGVFAPAINISNDPAVVSDFPVIAVSGNNVHVVWMDDSPGINDIFYRRSTNGGASFVEPIKNLSNNPGLSRNAAIAVFGTNVYVVWHDNTPGNFDIFYTRSVNGGVSFPEFKNLSDNSGESAYPAIASTGSSVHVVWQDNSLGNSDIFYRRSTDGGATFPNVIKNLSSNAGFSGGSAIAVFANNVHVVWTDNSEIRHRRSINGGDTFPNIILNLSNNAGTSFMPAVAVSGTNVYVVWQDNTKTNFDILYRPSANGGVTFDPAITNLSTNAGDSSAAFGPGIAVSE